MKSPSGLPRCEPGFGCFKACPLTTCESVVMWRRSGNFVDFKIVARLDRPNNRWVAIGFSPTGRMVCFMVVSVKLLLELFKKKCLILLKDICSYQKALHCYSYYVIRFLSELQTGLFIELTKKEKHVLR